jgi:hypothetical protein
MAQPPQNLFWAGPIDWPQINNPLRPNKPTSFMKWLKDKAKALPVKGNIEKNNGFNASLLIKHYTFMDFWNRFCPTPRETTLFSFCYKKVGL